MYRTSRSKDGLDGRRNGLGVCNTFIKQLEYRYTAGWLKIEKKKKYSLCAAAYSNNETISIF